VLLGLIDEAKAEYLSGIHGLMKEYEQSAFETDRFCQSF